MNIRKFCMKTKTRFEEIDPLIDNKSHKEIFTNSVIDLHCLGIDNCPTVSICYRIAYGSRCHWVNAQTLGL